MNAMSSRAAAAWIGITFGCSTAAAARASRRKRARIAGSSTRSGEITFNATSRSSSSSRAQYTTPIPPRPSSDSMR